MNHQTRKSAEQAAAVTRQGPNGGGSPASAAALESDAQRIAAALETKNTYDQSDKGQQDAHEAASAARDAANWAGGMEIAAWLETAITGVGVLLVGLTLRAAQRMLGQRRRHWNSLAKIVFGSPAENTREICRQ